MREWGVPGLAIGIVKGDRVIHAEGYGLSDVERGRRVTKDTLFCIGSCTKAFTATGIAMLVDEGRLEWDKPVREYLPSFRMRDPVATKKTTLRDLLTHQWGLPAHNLVWFGSPATRAEVVRGLRHLEANRQFRSGFQYSGMAYLAAAAAVERVTGKTWEQFTRERLLEPLGMRWSHFLHRAKHGADVVPSGSDVAVGYAADASKAKGVGPYFRGRAKDLDAHWSIGPMAPAGGMVSSIAEMCRWLRFQLNRGKAGKRPLITERSLQETHTPQVVSPGHSDGKELLDASYALGWWVQPYREHRLIWHGGSLSGLTAGVSFMPGESIGIVVLTNKSRHPLWRIVPYRVYDLLLGLDPIAWNARMKKHLSQWEAAQSEPDKRGAGRGGVAASTRSLEHFVGEYVHPAYGRVSIATEGRRLAMRYHRMTYRVRRRRDAFEIIDPWDWRAEVTFDADRTGKVRSLRIPFEPNVSDIVFTRTD
jgi:CubicO group peptidase (beta-lactamase class C family)